MFGRYTARNILKKRNLSLRHSSCIEYLKYKKEGNMCTRIMIVVANALVLSASIFSDPIEYLQAKMSIQGCQLTAPVLEGMWLFNENSLFSAAQLAGDQEPIKTYGNNEPFLWGLRGFALTFIPGVVGIAIGSVQGGARDEQIGNSLGYGTVGALAGAGSSLVLSLIASRQVLYLGPTFIGDLVGLGTLSLVAVAIYPEIVAILLIEFVVLPVGYFFRDLFRNM